MMATVALAPTRAAAQPARSFPPGPAPAADAYSAVDLDGLVLDSILDFDLYLRVGDGQFVLFRSTNRAFTVQHRSRLVDHGSTTLYVRREARAQYARYLERNLGAVMDNPEVPPRKKAHLLYAVSRSVVQDALSEPRAAAIVPRTRRLASETVGFVLKTDRALVQLASIMATDYYTYTHSINVCAFSVALGHAAGLTRDEVTELALGSLLHDVGKNQVPKDILTKSGPLTDDEFGVVRRHVAWGEETLAAHASLSRLAMLPVRQHHERLDASGYPRGLPAESIHPFGRVAAIADCFDAMTTNRSYQRAMSGFEALHAMRTRFAARYDQELLVRFIGLLRPEPERHVAA